MRRSYKQLLSLSYILLVSCSSNIRLIDKTRTPFGSLKFYSEKMPSNKDSVERIYASVDSSGYRIYYSFYPNAIIKRMETNKQTNYSAFFSEFPKNYNNNTYIKFTSLDSLILEKGDKLIDSFSYKTLKKSNGAIGYIAEIVYYHGWPKNKKFKP